MDGCGALAQGLVTVVALSVFLAFVDWAAHPGAGPLQRAASPAELVAAGARSHHHRLHGVFSARPGHCLRSAGALPPVDAPRRARGVDDPLRVTL